MNARYGFQQLEGQWYWPAYRSRPSIVRESLIIARWTDLPRDISAITDRGVGITCSRDRVPKDNATISLDLRRAAIEKTSLRRAAPRRQQQYVTRYPNVCRFAKFLCGGIVNIHTPNNFTPSNFDRHGEGRPCPCHFVARYRRPALYPARFQLASGSRVRIGSSKREQTSGYRRRVRKIIARNHSHRDLMPPFLPRARHSSTNGPVASNRSRAAKDN